ncbi:MAG: LytTR family DNA-binding domain-containing protein, partial [Eubacteriales bacterium]|nr:LytTR family DNA-binding domain-containing protein [Eubacteriales bacterium]
QYLDQFFSNSDTDYQVTEYTDGKDLLTDHPAYDIIFLDVEMEHSNGIDVARTIREKDQDTTLIFISQMAKYAVDGYKVDAFDYVVKPVDYYSFELKLKKALHYRSQHKTHKIRITSAGKTLELSTSDILYAEVFDHELVYHTLSGRFSTRNSLENALAQLEQYHFCQCNRYCIVNLKHVTLIQNNEVVVGSTSIQLSKRKKKDFVNSLLLYFGGKA